MVRVTIKDKKTKKQSYIYFSNLEQVAAFYKTQYPNFPMDAPASLILDIGHIFTRCECSARYVNF